MRHNNANRNLEPNQLIYMNETNVSVCSYMHCGLMLFMWCVNILYN